MWVLPTFGNIHPPHVILVKFGHRSQAGCIVKFTRV